MSEQIARPPLRVDWCSRGAAKYACENWHHARSLPGAKLLTMGVWEADRFIGSIIYSRGGTANIGKPFGLSQDRIVELTRIAFDSHDGFVSQAIAHSLRLLRSSSPCLRLVISYADSSMGHNGAIYQATNWMYIGEKHDRTIRLHGKLLHPRSLVNKYGTSSIPWLREHVSPDAEAVMLGGKYKYAMPLDKAMKRQIAPLALPYPPRQQIAIANPAEVRAEKPRTIVLPGFDDLVVGFGTIEAKDDNRLDVTATTAPKPKRAANTIKGWE